MSRYLLLIILIYTNLKGDSAYAFYPIVEPSGSLQFNAEVNRQHNFIQANEANHAVKGIKYRCPPCGCSNDHSVFSEKGNCTMCGMPLIPVNYGTKKQADKFITPFFKNGMLGKVYPKLIYPIFAIGILFSSFLLFFSIGGKSLNIYLISIILILSLYGFKNQLYGVNDGLTSNYKSLFTPISAILLLGPLLFFYVKSLLFPSFKWRGRYGVHFIPALLMFLFYAVLLVMPGRVQTQFMSSPFEVLFSHTEQIITVAGGFLYLVSAVLLYKKWKTQHGSQHTWLTAWLKRFITGMSVLLLFWGTIIIINFWLYNFGIATITYNPLWICFGGVLLWLFIEVLLNPTFFLIKKRTKYAGRNGIMTDEQFLQYKSDLETLMSNQKLYTDPNLSLNKLAQIMGVNPRYLSMILNTKIGKNFYDFINYYRVEEVKQLLKDPDNRKLTIEAIANKSGFKSKSSFNSAFRKYVHMTPREYINSSGSY